MDDVRAGLAELMAGEAVPLTKAEALGLIRDR